MLWRPCNCASGCVQIREARASLREGAFVKIARGSLKGTDAQVLAVQNTQGGTTLVLTNGSANGPSVCQRELRSSALGYACATSNFDKPVAPDVCANGC